MKNNFLTSIYQRNALTENGALSNSTTGNSLLDYFSKCGTYRDRSLETVFADISMMWAESPLHTLKVVFYNRMITRNVRGSYESEKVQMGQGNKDEFRKALIWLAKYQPEALYKNLWIIPMVGYWKDLWHIDLINELDHQAVFQLIEKGIACDYNKELLAKYLPRIRSKSNVYNNRHERLNRFAFALIKYLKWTPVMYRKFKANGVAHEFQKKMCNGLFYELDFNSIPGKALYNLVNKKGKDQMTTFERHGLDEAYLKWIKEQPVAKFTGYVYELMNAVNGKMSLAQKYTIDKQFGGLIALAQKDNKISENVWCALDTSGSMGAKVGNTTAYDICLSLGIYFSTLNQGAFKDHVMMFDNVSSIKKLSGSFSDKVMQLKKGNTAWGSTNFQSVIDEIIRVRVESPDIPLSEFPTSLVVVSDMQFNPVGSNAETNYEAAMRKLQEVGLPKIRIVWWWVTGRTTDFPSTLDDDGVIMIGGFDGAILSMLLSNENDDQQPKDKRKKQGPYEAMLKAIDQEILGLITMNN